MSSVIVVKRGYRRAVIAAGMRGAPGAGGGGSAGVSSFNTRTGPVTLMSADVSGALGYTPANSADLAGVALSGAYADLLGLPAIPADPADINAATAAQGAKADTAVQPAALTSGLAGKVDKDGAKGLSDENYTAAEKAKLAGLEGAHFKGLHASLAALQAAHPSAVAGDYADVDSGAGADVARYIWDTSDSAWIIQSGASGGMTAAQIKTAYESNPDTNVFSDTEQAKLGAIASGATANATNAELRERSTHTGTQTASTISDFAETVRATVLTGLSLASGAAITAADSALAALGKLQKQITDLVTAVAGKQEALVSGTTIKTVNGSSLLGAGDLAIAGGGASLPVIRPITGNETLALANINTFGVNATASNYTSTIPAQATVAWTADAEMHFLPSNTGDITITAAAGVSLNGVVAGSLTLSTQNGAASLKRTGADAWWLGGVIGTTTQQLAALGVVKQTGVADTTAGSVLINGAHGLGGVTGNKTITDFDGININTFARSGSAAANAPLAADFNIINLAATGLTNSTLAFNWSAVLPRMFLRSQGTSYGPWVEMWSSRGVNAIVADTGSTGYGTGSGGTATQATSKATAVTLNKPSGQITTAADALAANAVVSFTLTNNKIAANDIPEVVIKSGATAGAYVAQVDAVAAGSCRISVRNMTAGSLSEALVLQFNVEKGAIA